MTSPSNAPTREIGYAQPHMANVATSSNWWMFDDETTPELRWPQSVYVYDQMRRTDAQVTSVLRAVTLPVRRTPWRLDPAGARDEVVQLVAEDLGLPIVGLDPKPLPRARDRFSWLEHLREALLMLPFGHMYFEQNVRIVEGRARLRKLAARMPKTIEEIDVARDGGLVSIKQYSVDSVRQPAIPVGRLVAYVNEKEGGDWLGRSLLRSCYKNWLIKDRLLRVQAQTIERNGMGVPLYTAPPGATAADIATGADMAQRWRSGEDAGSAIPNEAKMQLLGVEGTLPDADPAIRYHDEQIARAVLAHFLNLGTQTGSWALGTTFADFFTLSLQTLAQQVADVATQHVVEDLVDWNWGEDEPAPRIVFDEIGSRQAATAEAIRSLIDAGVITPDEVLEGAVRQQFGLPPKDPNADPVPVEPVEPVADDAAGPKEVTAKFNPHQPRDPGGDDGGQWVKRPGGGIRLPDIDPLGVAGEFSSGHEVFRGSARVGDGPEANGVNIVAVEADGDPYFTITTGTAREAVQGDGHADDYSILADEQIRKLSSRLPKAIAAAEKGEPFDAKIGGEDNGDVILGADGGKVTVSARSWGWDEQEDEEDLRPLLETREDFEAERDPDDEPYTYEQYLADHAAGVFDYDLPEPTPPSWKTAELTADQARELLAEIKRLTAPSPISARLRWRSKSGPKAVTAHLPGKHPQRSHGNDHGVDVIPGDKLKLAGRIDLKPGEKLLSSQRIRSGQWDVLAAEVDTAGGREVRLGVIDPSDRGKWTAGPNATRAARVAELDRRMAEMVDRDGDDATETEQYEQLREERDELADDSGDLNRTTSLTPEQVSQLRSGIEAGIAKARADIARDERPDSGEFASGVVPGGLDGDVEWRIDDAGSGDDDDWTMWLAIRPRDEGDDWIPEGDDVANFDPASVKQLLKALTELSGDQPTASSTREVKASSGRRVRAHRPARRKPVKRVTAHTPGGHQHNQQSHAGGPDISGPLLGAKVFTTEQYERSYGDVVDERSLGVDEDGMALTVRFFELGDAHLVVDLPGGHQVVGEFDGAEGMRALAEGIRTVQHEKLPDSAPTGDVVADHNSRDHPFYLAKDDYGDIRLRDDDADEDDYLEFGTDEAWELFDALNDLADSYDAELNPEDDEDGEVEAAAGSWVQAHTPGGHEHNQQSHGNDHGGPDIPNPLDKLKLAGRIHLGQGEKLLSSQRIRTRSDADGWDLMTAETDTSAGRQVRLGVIHPDDSKNWAAGPDPKRAKRIAELDVEIDRLENGPELSDDESDRLEELQSERNDLREFDRGNVNRTAIIDPASVAKMRADIDAGIERAKAWSKSWKKIATEEDNVRFDYDMDADEREERLAEIQVRFDALGENDQYFLEGSIPGGPEGDLHYLIGGTDDGEGGWKINLGIKPHDADESWHVDSNEATARFEGSDVKKLLKALAELSGNVQASSKPKRWVQAHLPGLHPQDRHGRRFRVPGDPSSGLRKSQRELRESARQAETAQELDDLRLSLAKARQRSDAFAKAAAKDSAPEGKPTSTPSRMTSGQYTKILKDEHVRLQLLNGKTEKEAKAAARPKATIDELKARNTELRKALRVKGVDHRTEEQRRADDVEKNTLLDEVEKLAAAGGHDGAAKRAAAAKMSRTELRKFVGDVKDFQRRQKAKKDAEKRGAAAESAFRAAEDNSRATPRQVGYIVALLRQRARSGDGGGFMVGPTETDEIRKMSKSDASAYINSLTDNY
jgi:hypothetical protein